MATTLTATFDLTGFGSYTNPLNLSTPVDNPRIGSGGFAEIKASITNGTGSGQCDLWFHDQRSVAGTSNDNIDLAGSVTNPITGAAMTFVKIKVLLIKIVTPTSTYVLRVGPGVTGASNAWIGPWIGTSPYETVYDTLYKVSLIDGWGTITAGSADTLCIYNPGSVAIVYNIWLIGTSA